MNIYLVKYVRKGAGYKYEDSVTSGGSYDLHGHEIITANTKAAAQRAVEIILGKLHGTGNKVVVRQPELVLELTDGT